MTGQCYVQIATTNSHESLLLPSNEGLCQSISIWPKSGFNWMQNIVSRSVSARHPTSAECRSRCKSPFTQNKCSFNYIAFNCFDFSPWFTFEYCVFFYFFVPIECASTEVLKIAAIKRMNEARMNEKKITKSAMDSSIILHRMQIETQNSSNSHSKIVLTACDQADCGEIK